MKKKYLFLTLLLLFFTINSCCKKDPEPVSKVPTVTTEAISNITQNSVEVTGKIVDDGGNNILESGICYSTSPNPTLENSHTTDGITDIDTFTSVITGLYSGTTYFVRAYASNIKGTAYGDEKQFTTDTNTTPVETVLVEGGTFIMGNSPGHGEDDQQPQHSVTVNSFRISKYEITNQQFADWLNSSNLVDENGHSYADNKRFIFIGTYSGSEPTHITHNGNSFVVEPGKENYPVTGVSWYGAKAYCEYYGGRLPTEAEWEFAARGGNDSNYFFYSGSNNVEDVAWYYYNSENADNSMINGKGTHPVGQKNPNELGLFDMSGNVYEWINDWYDENYYSNSPSVNPQGPSSGTYRVLRGGSWDADYPECFVADRSHLAPEPYSGRTFGFRPVFAP